MNQQTLNPADRRRFVRYEMRPAYTAVRATPIDGASSSMEGHSYDLSEGGVQFELDRAIEPGTPIGIEVMLPALLGYEPQEHRSVKAFATVVWVDDSEPGPVRMAVVFRRFATEDDHRRLMQHLRTGRYRAAA